MKGSFLVSFLFVVSAMILYTPAKAADGCYVAGVLYDAHTPKSGAYFYRTPNTIATCGYVGTLSGACRLYDTGDITKNTSYTRYNGSYSTSISVIPCPLDDSLLLLVIPITACALFRFRLEFKH